MICFEPVQVSTAFSNYRRPTTIKVATNLTRSCTLCWNVGDVGTRVCLPALGAEGSILAGGSPYSARPAPNKGFIWGCEIPYAYAQSNFKKDFF